MPTVTAESGRNITRIARSGFVHHGMNFLFRANVEQAFAQMYGKQSFPMERMDIAALWLLCNSYDNMKVKLPKRPAMASASPEIGMGNLSSWHRLNSGQRNQRLRACMTSS